MTISWTSLADADNGGDPIIFYAVELYDAGTDTWNQLNFDFGNLYTTYTHTSASNFQASTQFFFRVRPKNSIGYSQTASTDVELLSDGVPNGMTAPYAGAVTPTSIEVKWDSLTDPNLNGGDEPIFYELEWEDKETDPNNPSWVTLVIDGDGLMLSFIHQRASVFTSGSMQKYRVRPKNHIDWGTVYGEGLLQADEVPISMSTPTRGSVDPNSIQINWPSITSAGETGRDDVVFYHV